MSFRLGAFLLSAVAGAGLLQAHVCQAQQVPSVPTLPTVPAPPGFFGVTPSGTSGLQSGIATSKRNPLVAPARAQPFDEGGVATIPGADNATQSTNATNATSATSGQGFSNGRR